MGFESSLRILVIDDDELTRRVTCLQLEANGHLADPCSVTAALSAKNLTSWDVVLADICLPHAEGIALLRHLAAELPSAHLVVMTAHWTSADTLREAMRLGARASLTKPFQFGDLQAILGTVHGNRKAGSHR